MIFLALPFFKSVFPFPLQLLIPSRYLFLYITGFIFQIILFQFPLTSAIFNRIRHTFLAIHYSGILSSISFCAKGFLIIVLLIKVIVCVRFWNASFGINCSKHASWRVRLSSPWTTFCHKHFSRINFHVLEFIQLPRSESISKVDRPTPFIHFV